MCSMSGLLSLIDNANLGNNPINKVKEFMERQEKYKAANDFTRWRLLDMFLK